jgi:hypothetical protein
MFVQSFVVSILVLGLMAGANARGNSIKEDFDKGRQLTAESIPSGTTMFQGVCEPGSIIGSVWVDPYGERPSKSMSTVLCLYSAGNHQAMRLYGGEKFYCPIKDPEDGAYAVLRIVGNNDLGQYVDIHSPDEKYRSISWHILRRHSSLSYWLTWLSEYFSAVGSKSSYEYFCRVPMTPVTQLPHAPYESGIYTIHSALIRRLSLSSVTLSDPASGKTWTATVGAGYHSLLSAMSGSTKADVVLRDGYSFSVEDVILHP